MLELPKKPLLLQLFAIQRFHKLPLVPMEAVFLLFCFLFCFEVKFISLPCIFEAVQTLHTYSIPGKKSITQCSYELSLHIYFKLGVNTSIIIYTSSQLSASNPRILSTFSTEQIQTYKTPYRKQVREEKVEWAFTENSSKLMDVSMGLQQSKATCVCDTSTS